MYEDGAAILVAGGPGPLTTEPQVAECQSTTHLPITVTDRKGQPYCFNCIIEAIQGRAYGVALRVLGDAHLAQDGVQEAFISAYRAFASFRGDNLTSWMLRIVSNACRDILRSRRARPSFSLESMVLEPDEPFSPVIELPSVEATPEQRALAEELGRAIGQGLQLLPYEQRLAVTLVDIEGLSYEEAAQTMNTSQGTVKSRVSRGRSGLRNFLRQQGELLPAQFRQDK